MKIEVVTITCDICGKDEATTVRFGFDGKDYTIDLDKGCLTKLTNAMAPFVNVARKPQAIAKATAKRKQQAASRHARKEATAIESVEIIPPKRGRPRKSIPATIEP